MRMLWFGFIRFAAFAAAASGVLGNPILVYDFNETGTNAPSTGSDSTPLYLYATNGVCTDLHAGPGSGTTGQPGDRCLDLSAATGMGSTGKGPLARHLGDDNAIDDLTSFTLCGWYKSPYATAGYARFLNNSGAGWGWELSCGGGGTLALDILPLPKGTATAPAGSFNDLNKWIYFAITYDGTANTNNVRIYRGYLNVTEAETRPVFTCVATNTVDKGKVLEPGGNAALVIGNTYTYDRPFRGYLDNLRIYGHHDDASGALDETAVQAVWATATRPGTNLLLEYGFNGSGTEAASTGYYTNGLTLRDSADALTDLHGPAGSGVRGETWDRALSLTNATGMGDAPAVGPVARHAADLDLVDTLVSFTATGWYKTSVPGETPAKYANFINNGSGTTGYIIQNYGSTSKAIQLNVNNVGGCATANNTFSDANKWVFFAVTYDSTSTTNNARFYRGYRTQAEAGANPLLACVSTNTYLAGVSAADSAVFCVGNRPDRARPLRAFMDNIRLYGSKRDGSAALDETAIAAIRSADYPSKRGTLVTVW